MMRNSCKTLDGCGNILNNWQLIKQKVHCVHVCQRYSNIFPTTSKVAKVYEYFYRMSFSAKRTLLPSRTLLIIFLMEC